MIPRLFLDFFGILWCNKMRKYGVPGPEKSRNHVKSKNDVYYHEIEILLAWHEAEKSIKTLNQFF